MHGPGVVQGALDQLGLAALANLGVGGGQERVQARRREGLRIETLAVGLGERLLQEFGLLRLQHHRHGGELRRGGARQHLAERRTAAGGGEQDPAHGQRAGCCGPDAKSGAQRHYPLAHLRSHRIIPVALGASTQRAPEKAGGQGLTRRARTRTSCTAIHVGARISIRTDKPFDSMARLATS